MVLLRPSADFQENVSLTSRGWDMMLSLFKTDNAWSSLVLRLTLGLVMFPHGAQKLLGESATR